MPPVSDRGAWHRSMRDPAFQPFAHTLARMDNALAASCLCSLADDVAQRCSGGGASGEAGNMPSPAAGSVAMQGGGACGRGAEGALPAHLGLWLYGLMVRLELPISADVAAAMRRVVVVAERCQARRVGERGRRCDDAEALGKDEGVEDTHGGGCGAGEVGAVDEAMECEGSGVRGVDDEQAMYDTLRVVAGGFFGQDGALAPVVDDYLVRMSLR